MSNKFFIICTSVIILLIAFNMYSNHAARVEYTATSGQAAIGSSFTLTNQRGEKVSDTDFRDKLMLVFFGFTNCPAICPTDLAIMSTVMTELGNEAEKVAPIFITVDPERDTVEQLLLYMQNFHPSITALTGTQAEIDNVLAGYKIYARKVENEMMEGYMFDHSAYTYLMDKSGNYITHFPHDSKPEEIVKTLKQNF